MAGKCKYISVNKDFKITTIIVLSYFNFIPADYGPFLPKTHEKFLCQCLGIYLVDDSHLMQFSN